MELKPKTGLLSLKFGMWQKDVESVLGKPDRQYKDEDQNIVYLYNSLKLRLTFYADEEYRLGYLIVSHPEAVLFSHKMIGKSWHEVETILNDNRIRDLQKETFDSLETYFDEANWLIFETEFGSITRVEAGAVIQNDEFKWAYNK